MNLEERRAYNRNWYHQHREKIIRKRKKFKKNNKDIIKKWELNYISNYRNWLREGWARARRRSRKNKIEFNVTFDQVLRLWKKHKKKYGSRCIYSNVKMTFIRGKNKVTPTNLSIDRINNNKGYVVDNIVFCTNEFNRKKGYMSIADCRKVLKIYNQRYK